MDAREFKLLIDLHKNRDRLGPGSSEETRKALSFLKLDEDKKIKIADIGCGTGAQTLTLAQNTNSNITAIDIFPEFLKRLKSRAEKLNLSNRITVEKGAMEKFPNKKREFDVIWSEGAIYIMGFENGIKAWKPRLKPGGYLVVSDICWFTKSRPEDLDDYWDREDVEIATVGEKMTLLEKHGYSSLAYFRLPDYCWLEEYYAPLENYFQQFLIEHNHSDKARDIVKQVKQEIELYQKYKEYYGYGFFIAKKGRARNSAL